MTDAATSERLVAADRNDNDDEPMAVPLNDKAGEPLASHAADNSAELFEPGRALALADFQPPKTGAGEKLIRLAYRLGVPGSTLTAPFRKPGKSRLLATVESPLTGDRSAGVALRAGHFLVHGVKAPITQMDFAPKALLTPPFERTVHGFSWLRDLASCGPREQCAPTAERVLTAWLDANPKTGKGAAWSVENAAHRLLNWLVHAPLLIGGQDKKLRNRTLIAATETARWLDRNVGKADDRLSEVAGWTAITAAGLLLPDGKPRRLFGEAGLMKALGELVGEDGGVLSRSPLDQMDAIALLVELSACYRATRRDPPDAIEAMLGLLVPPLLAVVHSDGAIGSWQGANAVPADRISALVEASNVRVRPLRDVRQWGYQRVKAGKSVLQFDAAPPPLARHTRTGCASTLALEFSHAGQRIFVNCGGAGVAGGQTPVRIERGLRATAAHSTLVLDDANSTAVLIRGKLGSGVGEVEVDRRTMQLPTAKGQSGTATRIEASHDGYAARFALTHRRILTLRDEGTELRGEDMLVPSGRKAKRGKVGYAIRFHIGPGVELGLSDDKRGAGLALPDGSYWQMRMGGDEPGKLEIEESLWIDADGRPQPIQQLVLQGMVSRGGANFTWLLKKMG
ncbi:heparinase II/III family protein [Altererythrobacter aquiaggeris]|uniref:heparinase II/III family protein n=1 Tax=Aestuarierythrobacter aquiaggeris TaxID=1898396 RepID=UPI003017FFA9